MRTRAALTAAVLALMLSPVGQPADASAPTGLCGHAGAPVPIRHVIVVMLENHSFRQVLGSAAAPYETSLAAHCGDATAMFATTHASAANYLATSAGEYPAASRRGCSSAGACADASNNLYHQLDTSGLSWRSYEESMPDACAGASHGGYKIGHNPAIFYRDVSLAECRAKDVPVASLTAQSGRLFDDLRDQTLPTLSWVTPNKAHDGEGSSNQSTSLREADSWLAGFMALVQQSASYQAGNTLVFVTYDEGSGGDSHTGEDCTDKARDLPITNGVSAHQDSCHIPLLVVYPYSPAGTSDATFFDHYSLTKTVEDLFGLPHLAHAADAQTTSLIGHFGIR